jgi:imidazolonepropionase-like amidohydrolase
VKKGVKIAYGTDAGVYPNGLNARQFRNMVKYGLSPMQAIQSATLWAADLIGWPKQVGAISAGHWADMAAVGADPIADISVLEQVSHVMKGGVVVR